MAKHVPTTDDIGTAIRDALDLLGVIEISEAMAEGEDIDEEETVAEVEHVDAEDPSNLKIVTRGAVFVVRIIREG